MGAEETVIQVVDDDPAIVRLVRRYLEREGFRVIAAWDGRTALSQFDREEPDLVVLDIGLPDVDGLEVSRRLRAKSDVPVIMLTARGREEEVIEGFDAGADDYLAKPFSPGVLLARVKAALRHYRPKAETAVDRIEWNDLVVDFSARKVTRGGQLIHLTRTEYSLLALLAQHRGKVVTSGQILTEVWGSGYASDSQVLRLHIGRLRKKVEPVPARPSLILTEPGVGYWLNC
jgi:two-component system KDP operon response regulator KdpE